MACCCTNSEEKLTCSCPTTLNDLRRRGKVCRKDEAELSCSKPQLSLMRDRDKRLRLILPAVPPPPLSSILNEAGITETGMGGTERHSVLLCSRQEEKTNGCTAANNCPMTLFKYLCPSVQFLLMSFSFLSLPSCCYFSSSRYYSNFSLSSSSQCFHNDNNNNARMKTSGTNTKESLFREEMKTTARNPAAHRKRCTSGRQTRNAVSTLIPCLLLCFGILSEIIYCSNASPIGSAHSPLPLASDSDETGIINKNRSLVEEDDSTMKHSQMNQGRVDSQTRLKGYHTQLLIDNENTLVEDDNRGQTQLHKAQVKISGAINVPRNEDRSITAFSGNDSPTGSSTADGNDPVEFIAHNERLFAGTGSNKNRDKVGVDTEIPKQVVMHSSPQALKLSPSFETVASSPSSRYQQHRHRKQDNTFHVTNGLHEGDGDFDDEKNAEESESSGDSDNYRNEPGQSTLHSTNVSSSNLPSAGLCRYQALFSGESHDEMKPTMKSSSYLHSTVFHDHETEALSSLNEISVFCNGTSNLAVTLEKIPDYLLSQVISLRIRDSSISTLNLSLFQWFPRLENLSVTHSNVSLIIGRCPRSLLSLNISYNVVRKIDGGVFRYRLGTGTEDDDEVYEEEIPEDENEHEDSGEEDDGDNDGGNKVGTEFDARGKFPVEISPFSVSSPVDFSKERKPQIHNRNKSEHFSLVSQSKSSSSQKLPPSSQFIIGQSISEKLVTGTTPPISRTKRSINNRESRSAKVRNGKELAHPEDNGRIYDPRQLNRNARKRELSGQDVLSDTAKTTNERNDDEDPHRKENNDLDVAINAGKGEHNDPEIEMRGKEISSGADKESTDDTADNGCRYNSNNCNSELGRKRRALVPKDKDSNKNAGNGNDGVDNDQRSRDFAIIKFKSENYRESKQEVVGPSSIPDYRQTADKADTVASVGSDDSGSNKGDEERFEGGSKTSILSRTATILSGRRLNKRSVISSSGGSNLAELSLENVDLSHNKISEVPRTLLEMKTLKSLRLSGNQLKCDFVWDKLANWYMKSQDPNILKDGDDTFCGVVDDARVFQFTVLGVLKAKKDVVETCRTVDKTICHECGLYSLNKQSGLGYNLSHTSPRGNVAIALKLDCSYQNLTDLPPVPAQTWQLNVSGNFIKDLSLLKEPMYRNLLMLDVDNNEINNLDGLTGTPFIDKYNLLSLQNNRFTQIPSNVLSSLKNMKGQGVTFLGANFIECDCDVVKEIKPLLLGNSKQIKDLKEIYCKDMKRRSGESFMALKDLQHVDICTSDTPQSNEMYLYLIIFSELLLIFVIVAKVWHDQRTFRRTGILPWCSAKMPRLPCDAMLENVKEPPHFNRSSSTNVRSFACDHPTAQSISSHVQLREVRSNSGQSEKSSQISQLSSFPSSSRTSSV